MPCIRPCLSDYNDIFKDLTPIPSWVIIVKVELLLELNGNNVNHLTAAHYCSFVVNTI